MSVDWPKGPTYWQEGRLLRVSIPFTWDLPAVLREVTQRNILWDQVEVGGPAVELMPGFFDEIEWVREGHDCPGILQHISPEATRTTVGCTRRCPFCAIGAGRIEGEFRELDKWYDLPIVMDNNLLAATPKHIGRVMEGLANLGEADFNQGLDARLLTKPIAEMIAAIKRPIVRLALDSMKGADAWGNAFENIRSAGIAKKNIRTYCLVGYDTDPRAAWARCEYVEKHKVKAFPMWFHELDAMKPNIVTEKQEDLGWNDYERRRIMQWFYQHKVAVA